jgi:hypothetical protein
MVYRLSPARQPAAAAVALLALASCDRVSGPLEGDFRGVYVTGFEASAFRPCGWPAAWWLSGDLRPIFEVMPPADPGSPRAAYIHVRGARSGPGRYGHAGGAKYELVVREVLHASPDTVGKCQ